MDSEQQTTSPSQGIPQSIISWVGSLQLTHILIDLNDRLKLSGERRGVLPDMIYRLVTLDLEPRDVVSEIALKLGLSDSSSKIVAEELEKLALHPIENELKDELGVDISLLHFPREISEPRIKLEDIKVSAEPSPKSAAPKSAPIFPAMEPRIEVKVAPLVSSGQAIGQPSGPCILHAEKEEVRPTAGAGTGAGMPERPTFTIKIPITQKKYYSAPQVTAKIETPTIELGTIPKKIIPERVRQPVDESKDNNNVALRQAQGLKPTDMAPPMRPLSEIAEAGIKKLVPEQARALAGESKDNNNVTLRQAQGLKSSTPAPLTPAPVIKKVVHYSDFITKLME